MLTATYEELAKGKAAIKESDFRMGSEFVKMLGQVAASGSGRRLAARFQVSGRRLAAAKKKPDAQFKARALLEDG